MSLRNKSRVLPFIEPGLSKLEKLAQIPKWNYDGSSTGQAEGKRSEILIYPQNIYEDPFRGAGHYLVMCDTYHPKDDTNAECAHKDNSRQWANEIFKKKPGEEPWYGLEQEYFMMQRSGTESSNRPLGFPDAGQPTPQGQYYCACGAENSFGRDVAEEHLIKCLEAGLEIGGTNAEVAPGQWEYQIGPSEGINAGDELWMARYILNRVAEKHDVVIDIEPKPLGKDADWNGSGCHANFSTRSMREGIEGGKTGYGIILDCMPKLARRKDEHMAVYGSGNEDRMSGKHETARFDEFTWGVGNRGASVRIQQGTKDKGKGFFEDRRPSSNMDPYLVTGILFETCILL